ncbi:MAG: peptidoglycan DD-metalloendopeptidase family protein [Deltaproteobacteria bacterium]|nr:peptidoglycan DD-metalloendopeptidase family protein [Deltaproteobacteria bacterium]
MFTLSSAAEPSKVKREIVKKEKQLETIKREIIEKKRGLEYNVKKEHATLEELERLDKALSEKEEELVKIENSLAKLKQKSHEVNAHISELVRKKEKLSGLLEQRLAAMYKMKKDRVIMKTLFSSSSAYDLSRRYTYINKIIDYDANLLKDYTENQRLLEAEEERLREFEKEAISLKYAVEQKKDELADKENSKKALLKDIRKKKEMQLATIQEMESASKELQSFLDRFKKDLENNSAVSAGDGFVSMRGHLPMPVNGKIVAIYGKVEHPKFHTVTFNNGIEIEANAGAEVKSVYKGRIVYSGWFRGYGKVMIVDHGEGYYTLFAHLSKVIKDVHSIAEKDDVIALVGDTGSLKGPLLYFEIRQKGVPLDPLNWLAYDGIKVGSKQ